MGNYKQAIHEIIAEINKTVAEIEQKAKQRGYQAANVLTTEVKKVLSGQRSGRTYKVKATGGKSKKSGVMYTASAPGEPPAVRLGTLRQSFKRRTYSEQNGKELIVHAITESDLQVNGHLLGELLENGTKKIAPRPFKQKTMIAALPKIEQIFQRQYRNSKG